MPANNESLKCFIILALLIIFLFTFYERILFLSGQTDNYLIVNNTLAAITLVTAKLNTSYEQVNFEVFAPLGYEISEPSVPIPVLKFREVPSCSNIFRESLTIEDSYNVQSEPPKELPLSLIRAYNLNGHALLSSKYYNNKTAQGPREWKMIKDWIEQDPRNFSKYGTDGMALYHAMNFLNISESYGAVIGSITPWAEVFALQNGAKKTRVKYLPPNTVARAWGSYHDKFDFVVSYSTVQHVGLQRYGDPLDPIGDVREVLKMRCMLKTNGYLFLGLPRGQDQLVYNAHRIYGRLRLAILFTGNQFLHSKQYDLITGFQLLHVFRGDNGIPEKLEVNHFDGSTNDIENMDLFVLKKV